MKAYKVLFSPKIFLKSIFYVKILANASCKLAMKSRDNHVTNVEPTHSASLTYCNNMFPLVTCCKIAIEKFSFCFSCKYANQILINASFLPFPLKITFIKNRYIYTFYVLIAIRSGSLSKSKYVLIISQGFQRKKNTAFVDDVR